MKISNRVPSVPLLISDPFFSIWSPSDKLNGADTQSWTGKEMPISGIIKVDNIPYVFMGKNGNIPIIEQRDCQISATQTFYTFSNKEVTLNVTFSNCLDLNNLQLLSEPVNYISVHVKSNDDVQHIVDVSFSFSNKICSEATEPVKMNTKIIDTSNYQVIWTGKAKQTPLNSSGDISDIDWGRLVLGTINTDEIVLCKQNDGISANLTFDTVNNDTKVFVCAYDDIHSIEYFGNAINAYWKSDYPSIFELVGQRVNESFIMLEQCNLIDAQINAKAQEIGGDSYALICNLSYRQAICAHKLITDEYGDIVFLSKECSSNGCIGTVDVSYPSIPLFLLYNPELVNGMMRPIYRFNNSDAWEFTFPPHDVGRYPIANGQVYGSNRSNEGLDFGSIGMDSTDQSPDYYAFPAGQDIYWEKDQMPIEECGNMLIMSTLTYLLTGNSDFFEENLETNYKWADYLVYYGQDPENQLCTDDFGGHFAHNANLSIKAIVAIAAFSKGLKRLGETSKGNTYYQIAKKMTAKWNEAALEVGSSKLAFDQPSTWSMKYNVIWDKLLELNLFDDSFYKDEVKTYLSHENQFGIPLDSRDTYSKTDWIMWVSAMTDNQKEFEQIIQPIVTYINKTPDRVPFSDWFDTKTGKQVGFKNRTVVGAMFMPILKAVIKDMLNQDELMAEGN